MMARMSSSQFTAWLAFDQLEPISLGYRGDVQAGVVAATIANVYRDPRRRSDPYRPADFMPRWGEPERAARRDPRQLYAQFRAWALAAGGTKTT